MLKATSSIRSISFLVNIFHTKIQYVGFLVTKTRPQFKFILFYIKRGFGLLNEFIKAEMGYFRLLKGP
jgi:hypothetical protein